MQAFHTFAAERWFLSVSRREVATELPQTEEKRTARTTTPTTTAESVWSVFGGIAQTTGATNLGQGFPNWSPPPFATQSLMETVDSPNHQYTRPAGHPALVRALAEEYSKHLDRDIDGFEEIAVTVGASQALYIALRLYSEVGDEVIVMEPFFDLYLKQIQLTGASAKYIKLGGTGVSSEEDPWAIDFDKLESMINEKTRLFVLNSPHNPTGKVLTKSDQEKIATILRKYPNIIVLADEVYKYTVYNPVESGDSSSIGHFHFAKLPDMYDRTITIGSCGKTFGATGWQVGWMVGPNHLIKPVHNYLPCVQFCTSTPMQEALAKTIQVANRPFQGATSYYEWLRLQFKTKREMLEDGLLAAGIEPLPSQGGFFVMAKLPDLDVSEYDDLDEPRDWKLCRKIAKVYNIVGIPASSFFSPGYEIEFGPLARFAFCKTDDTLKEARRRCFEGAGKRVIDVSENSDNGVVTAREGDQCAAEAYVKMLSGDGKQKKKMYYL